MKLARELNMTRERLLNEMPASEFSIWLAMQRLDPLFDPWLANAINCSTMAATFGGKTKPAKFMPVPPEKPKTSTSSLKAYMKRRVKHGGD
jgi:hypothetical protein